MPTLTVYIVDAGAEKNGGKPPSDYGHMWYSINDGKGGGEKYYGFGPIKEGSPRGPGDVFYNDDSIYKKPYYYEKTITITDKQYDALKKFGGEPEKYGFSKFYNGLSNSCIDFVWKALAKAGLNNLGYEGVPSYPRQNANAIELILKSRSSNKLLNNVSNIINTAQAMRFFDPLILDLDNDGIETINVKDGAYFDHDGNAFAEQTGWAKSDDGLLVMDRNGDGIINTGKELFGDQTILQNGQRATDGFQALAELDSNSDGVIDISDTAFSNLKIWQDINGDGYSASDELFTLQEMGIQSINVAHTDMNTIDPQGNRQIQAGTFTRTDNSTASIGGFNLQRDVTYSIATEWLDVPDNIAALPDLQGYGNTYDLHQAMVRDTTGTLKTLIEQFISAEDPAVRDSLMDQILFKWTGSDTIDPASRGPNFDARRLVVIEKLMGQPFYGTNGSNPNVLAAPLLAQAYEGLFEMYYAQLMSQTHLKYVYDAITYTWDEATQSLKGDLESAIVALQSNMSSNQGAANDPSEFMRTIHGFRSEDMFNLIPISTTFELDNEDANWQIDSAGRTILSGTGANNILSADASVNTAIRGDLGNDILYGNTATNAFMYYHIISYVHPRLFLVVIIGLSFIIQFISPSFAHSQQPTQNTNTNKNIKVLPGSVYPGDAAVAGYNGTSSEEKYFPERICKLEDKDKTYIFSEVEGSRLGETFGYFRILKRYVYEKTTKDEKGWGRHFTHRDHLIFANVTPWPPALGQPLRFIKGTPFIAIFMYGGNNTILGIYADKLYYLEKTNTDVPEQDIADADGDGNIEFKAFVHIKSDKIDYQANYGIPSLHRFYFDKVCEKYKFIRLLGKDYEKIYLDYATEMKKESRIIGWLGSIESTGNQLLIKKAIDELWNLPSPDNRIKKEILKMLVENGFIGLKPYCCDKQP